MSVARARVGIEQKLDDRATRAQAKRPFQRRKKPREAVARSARKYRGLGGPTLARGACSASSGSSLLPQRNRSPRARTDRRLRSRQKRGTQPAARAGCPDPMGAAPSASQAAADAAVKRAIETHQAACASPPRRLRQRSSDAPDTGSQLSIAGLAQSFRLSLPAKVPRGPPSRVGLAPPSSVFGASVLVDGEEEPHRLPACLHSISTGSSQGSLRPRAAVAVQAASACSSPTRTRRTDPGGRERPQRV